MSAPKQLLALLKEEERVLRARRFDILPKIGEAKERLTRAAGEAGGADGETLYTAIRQQAEKNARLFEILIAATRSMQNRLEKAGRSAAAVGYTATGERLSYGDQKVARRV